MSEFPFDGKNDSWLIVGIYALILFALFLNLGSYPLFLEEPRRALIALEMMLGNPMVPTEFGEYYYKKPPIWNWIIIGSYKIFGYSEFSVRVFGVLSFFSMGLMSFWIGSKYVNFKFGVYSSLLFLVMVDALFYLTVVAGEIDLFYSAITYASFLVIFHFGEQRKYLLLFLIAYGLAAIGILTKGLPSLAFIGISLLVIFVDKREFKVLLSWRHFVGIFFFIGIIGTYFFLYNKNNDVLQYFDSMWKESRDKTLLRDSVLSLLKHLFLFPLDTLKNVAPASLLVFFVIRRGYFQELMQQRFLRFNFLLFIFNIFIYWISPEAGSRYIYMLLPFLVNIFLYGYFQYPIEDWRYKTWKVIGLVLLAIFSMALFGLAISSFYIKLPFSHPIAIGLSFGAVFALLFYIFLRCKSFRLLTLIVSFIFFRIVFDLTLHEVRAVDSPMKRAKDIGMTIAEITGEENVYLLGESRLSYTSAFYVTSLKQMVITKSQEINSEAFFISSEERLRGTSYKSYFKYEFRKTIYHLVKFQ